MSVKFFTLQPALGGLKSDIPEERLSDGDATILNNFSTDGYRIKQREYTQNTRTMTGTAGNYAGIGYLELESSSMIVCGTTTALSKYTSSVTSIATGYTDAGWFMAPWRKRMFICRFDMSTGAPAAFHSYDGTTLTATPYTVNGSTNYTVTHMVPHKSRMYLVLKETATGEIDLWYSGVNSISGALTVMDASGESTGLFNRGGHLLAVGSISRMSSSGDVSQFVMISSMGEVVVYEGSNPGATDWVLVRRFSIPVPIKVLRYTNSVISANGDVYVLTLNGVISINAIMGGDPIGIVAPIADALKAAWLGQTTQDLLTHYSHGIAFNETTKILAATIPANPNAPEVGGIWLTNMRTGASTRWTVSATGIIGYDRSFALILGASMWTMDATSSPSGQETADWEYGTSWSSLGSPYTRKTIKAIRVRLKKGTVLYTDDISVSIDADFLDSANVYAVDWTATEATTKPDQWIPVQSSGERFRIRLSGTKLTQLEIGAIDIKFETGSGVI